MAITYATWNPADKSTSLTLSGGNLVANSIVSGSYEGVRSTIGVSTGKWYWEYATTALGGHQMDGVALSTASMTSGQAYPGFDANGRGYFSDGNKFVSNTATAYGATFTTNDIIGVALDMDTGTVTMYKNNVSQGTMFTGLSGTFYAMVGLDGVGGSTLTANFGATAFTYTPPSGYNAGLYTGTATNTSLGFFNMV